MQPVPGFFDSSIDPALARPLSETDTLDADLIAKLVSSTGHMSASLWMAYAVEEAARQCRLRGLPVVVYRLPFMWLSSHRMSYGDHTSLFTDLMEVALHEGALPDVRGLWPLTAVDTACHTVVELSLLENRIHNIYNVVDARASDPDNISAWMDQLGIEIDVCTPREFLDAVKSRPTFKAYKHLNWLEKLPFFADLPDSQFFRGEMRVSCSNIRQDLPVSALSVPLEGDASMTQFLDDSEARRWPLLRRTVCNGLVGLMHKKCFRKDSKTCLVSAESVLERGKRLTGLDDLGDLEEFVVPAYHRFFKCLAEENLTTFMSRVAIKRTMSQFVANLLCMIDAERQHPEILKERIESPIFIVGLNRSGTTLLQHLMIEDPDNRSPILAEMQCPYGESGQYRPRKLPNTTQLDMDPRVDPTREMANQQIGLNSEFTLLHHRRATQAEEDLFVMDHCARGLTLMIGYRVAEFEAWLHEDNAKEIRSCYPFHKRFIQHLQYQREGRRWVFKMPFHALALEEILQIYPDARFVFAHRDPKDVMVSWCHLEHTVKSFTLESHSEHEIGSNSLRLLAHLSKCMLRFRKQHPELEQQGRCVDVYFEDFLANPIRGVMRIYRNFDIPLSPMARNRMWRYLFESRRMRKYLKVHYTLDKCGLTEADVKVAFQEYTSALEVGLNNITPHTLRERWDTFSSLARFIIASYTSCPA
eukprot:Polyplicarium_translucidae@DN3151_c0_g1_i2.p1